MRLRCKDSRTFVDFSPFSILLYSFSKIFAGMGMMVHACNSSYSRGRYYHLRIMDQEQPK
jgi:hypothetical protein